MRGGLGEVWREVWGEVWSRCHLSAGRGAVYHKTDSLAGVYQLQQTGWSVSLLRPEWCPFKFWSLGPLLVTHLTTFCLYKV